MKLPSVRLLVLDTETTGFVPVIHRVIEYACLIAEDGKVVKEYEQLLSTDTNDIPSVVQVLTQIFPKDLEGKPSFADSKETIASMLTPDTVVVGQNIPFDLRMLKGEGWDITGSAWIDTSMLASIVFPELKSYSLGYMSDALHLTHEPKHRALGDVRATTQMLSLCTQRFEELPAADLKKLQELASRGPEGYKRFFLSLKGSGKKKPAWLSLSRHTEPEESDRSIPATTFPSLPVGTVQTAEETLHPAALTSVLVGARKGSVIAVKNLDATMRRIGLPEGIVTLPPPDMLLSKEAAEKFLQKETLTTDELTIAMKLVLYMPETKSDMPVHGDEYAVWSGILAASAESPEYLARRKKIGSSVILTSQYELLRLAASDDPPFSEKTPLIIDDASMLEDTATSALGWTCLVSTLRAGSQGSEEWTKCTDLIELWVEKIRNGMDLRYLAPSDLGTPETEGLLKMIEKILDGELPHAMKRALDDLLLILDEKNLEGRITWIESFMDGNKAIKSVPEKIAQVLSDLLYSVSPVTLLVPMGSKNLMTIVPDSVTIETAGLAELPDPSVTVTLPMNIMLDQLILNAKGKTVLLVSSKRMIEDLFVKHAEACEKAGITLLCQGFSGGQGRMQAEFTVAASPAVMITTSWTYETMELAEGTVQTLVMQVLPFDHPSHAVFSRRALRYQDPFSQYSLPRLTHRLFRLLRTFRKHSSAGGTVMILDDRLRTKPYGRNVADYLKSLGSASSPDKEIGQMALL